MTEKRPPLRSALQRAIQEAVTLELARRAAMLWGDNEVPEPIPAVQNFVFAIKISGRPAILRLTHESHRERSEIEAELRWMNDLSARRLPVAPPLASLGGPLVEPLESAQGRFFAVCFPRLPGVAPDSTNPALWNGSMFEQLGAIFARLHRAAIDAAWAYERLPRRRSWRDESVVQSFHSCVPDSERRIHRAFDRLLALLDALPQTPESYGLIHADLNHANFFIAPDGLKIFDFDDSCFCWFAYDLIVPIFHFPSRDQALMDRAAREALRSMVRGYEEVRTFDRAWLELLPLFLKWRDLITYGFFYEQLEIPALPDKLRETFLAMRRRIEAGRPIAEIGDAR